MNRIPNRLRRALRALGIRPVGVALAAAFVLVSMGGPAAAKVKVVASITDLGSIASAVGGDNVEVVSINRSNTDPHRVEVLPSYMVKVAKAKVYLRVGMYLDQWAEQIIDGSHNGNLLIVDCSDGIEPLEKPVGRVNASMGDVHPNGNPHYWLDPRNGAIVARTVAQALSRVDPEHAADYDAGAAAFAEQCQATYERGHAAGAAMPIKDIITYHASWAYLIDAFGLELAGTIEPVPGIPPTAKHLSELVTIIGQQKIPVVLEEPYFSEEAGNFLERETGVRVEKVSPSCDDVSAGSYLAHFDRIIGILSSLAAPAN